jgi:hypothetical protein
VAVGVANVLLRLPVEVTGLHSALAAGLVCSIGVSVREVWRPGDAAAQENATSCSPTRSGSQEAR